MSDQSPATAATQTPSTLLAGESAPATTETTKPVGGLEGNGQVAQAIESQAKPTDAQPVKDDAPLKYELKLTEGSLLKPNHVEQVEAFAKSKGLSPTQAQELLAREESLAKGYQDQTLNLRKQEIDGWREAATSDHEYGGEKLSASAELASRAVKRFGGDKLAEILDQTGYGNHPEVIRAFYRIGKAMSEGQIVPGGTANGQVPIEDKFYGKKNK